VINPAGVLCELAVVWLQDHNCICDKSCRSFLLKDLLLCGCETKIVSVVVNPAGVLCELAVVWLRDQNRICVKSLGKL
jgi:hypothetical protein